MSSVPVPFLRKADELAAAQSVVLGSGAMVILHRRQRQEILLHLRDDKPGIWYPGHWALFGGATEGAESAAETAVREVSEEIGIELESVEPFCRVVDVDGSGQTVTVFAAALDVEAEEIVLTEGQAVQWFTPADTESLRITPFLHAALRAWLAPT